MQFKISKRYFLNALNNVSRAISPNSPVPSLSGIKIEVYTDYMVLTAADSTLMIKKEIKVSDENSELQIQEAGSIVIDARYLLEIIRKIDSEIVNVEIIDTTFIRIYDDQIEYKINGMKSSDYPSIDFSHTDTCLKIDANTLIQLIHQTTFAVSKKESRVALMGVNFTCDNGLLSAVATDSYRLSKKQIKVDSEDHFNITIPARTLDDVDKIIDHQQTIYFYISSKKVQFDFGDILIQSRLIDGAYPETSRLIPTTHNRELILKVSDVLNALERCSFIKNDGMNLVKLCANSELVNISSRNQEVGSSYENIKAISYEGEPLEIAFSGDYAKDAIRALNCDEVSFQFQGEMKAFLIKNLKDESVLELILPVRTYN